MLVGEFCEGAFDSECFTVAHMMIVEPAPLLFCNYLPEATGVSITTCYWISLLLFLATPARRHSPCSWGCIRCGAEG